MPWRQVLALAVQATTIVYNRLISIIIIYNNNTTRLHQAWASSVSLTTMYSNWRWRKCASCLFLPQRLALFSSSEWPWDQRKSPNTLLQHVIHSRGSNKQRETSQPLSRRNSILQIDKWSWCFTCNIHQNTAIYVRTHNFTLQFN